MFDPALRYRHHPFRMKMLRDRIPVRRRKRLAFEAVAHKPAVAEPGEGSIESYAVAGRWKKSPWVAERAAKVSGTPSAMAASTEADAVAPDCLITS
jgi:hypothetical protein